MKASFVAAFKILFGRLSSRSVSNKSLKINMSQPDRVILYAELSMMLQENYV